MTCPRRQRQSRSVGANRIAKATVARWLLLLGMAEDHALSFCSAKKNASRSMPLQSPEYLAPGRACRAPVRLRSRQTQPGSPRTACALRLAGAVLAPPRTSHSSRAVVRLRPAANHLGHEAMRPVPWGRRRRATRGPCHPPYPASAACSWGCARRLAPVGVKLAGAFSCYRNNSPVSAFKYSRLAKVEPPQ
jgi:hypothetical protein